MSNESTPHTLESLEALPRKADVIEIAAALGLDTEGTRAEITARILEAQAGTDGDSSGDVDGSPSSSSSSAGDDLIEAGDDGEEVGDAPIEAYVPPKPGPLCDTGKVALATIVASYFGVEEAPAEMPAIYEAIEAGKQPCVVVGTGNSRFKLQVFEELFDCDDVLRDVTDGVSANLARVLADKNLFPRG